LSNIPERESLEIIQRGIAAVRRDEYLLGFTILAEAYRDNVENKVADGLSYYGLCLALVEKKFKPAIELCKRAIELQFYHPEHYVNLARVYVATGNRRKALGVLEEGLRVLPDDENIVRLRREMGIRSRPAIPFLSRDHVLNRMLGRARHARKGQAARPPLRPEDDELR
jgi:tetratricopeptide (TPR) repeat protein